MAAMKDGLGDVGASSHEVCAADNPRTEVGTSSLVHDSEQEVVHEGVYGPWVVVARRKNGTKLQRSGVSSANKGMVLPPRVTVTMRQQIGIGLGKKGLQCQMGLLEKAKENYPPLVLWRKPNWRSLFKG